MEFLLEEDRKKTLRTRLYGDQEFSRFELEIVHTPIFQRLYNLKQLGFADRVFPDAVHSRFNHVLGVAHVAEKMARHLERWLRESARTPFRYCDDGANPVEASVEPVVLAKLLSVRVPVLRLMALLHDLTHAAFGHTLEDEVNVFSEKHDALPRQLRFFNALVAQLLYFWCAAAQLRTFDATEMENLVDLRLSDRFEFESRMASQLSEWVSKEERALLASRLRELEAAQRLLAHIEFAHGQPRPDVNAEFLVTHAAQLVDPSVLAIETIVPRDLFLVDLVGNTICADLLDYARRDADNAGLHVQFDDRFLRYLCVVSVEGELSPKHLEGRASIRTAIQIFTGKMRHDVLSEVSGILKARYLINERVLFHPTKCAAGAMLGTAVQLLSLGDLPDWMLVLGDQELLRTLISAARNLHRLAERLLEGGRPEGLNEWADVTSSYWPTSPEMGRVVTGAMRRITRKDPAELTREDLTTLADRAVAARNVLWKLSSRRFPKLVYRLRVAKQSAGESDETIADKFRQADARYELERRIEVECNLPKGTIFIHCPQRKTSTKVAEALVIGADPTRCARLREVTKVSSEGLQPYEDEIRSIEDMYRSIWQFHAFVDPTYWDKQPVIEWIFERELTFANDKLLASELDRDHRGVYHLLARELKDEIAPVALSQIIQRVDEEIGRLRTASVVSAVERLREIIGAVHSERGRHAAPSSDRRVLSLSQFRSGCREIFMRYTPTIGDGRLLDHHRAFIARTERRPAEERFIALELLKRYDLSDLTGMQTYFQRGTDPYSEEKLRRIDNEIDQISKRRDQNG